MESQNKFLTLFKGLQFKGNIYVSLFLRFGIAMLLFSVCRFGFYLYNTEAFPAIGFGNFITIMLGGLRFDLTALIYTNLIFILMMIVPFKFRFRKGYQLFCQWVFFIFNGLALAANVADFVYFQFTGRRTTADIFQQFENETNLGSLFFRFLWDYWHAAIFWMALLAIMVWLYKKIKIEGPQLNNKVAFYTSGTLAVPLLAYLLIGSARGDFMHSTRPITLSDAGKYVRDPQQVSVVLNTPFAIYRTLGKTKIKKVNYFSEEEVAREFSPIRIPTDTGSMKKLNVIIIVLESFSREFVGFYNHHRNSGTYQGYTPFIDSLTTHSKTFTYTFSNGRKSIDALPTVIAGVPSMSVPYVLSPFSGNKINSLGTLLKGEGYSTSFFHGAPNGSMGFEAFMNIAGIDNYYGMTEYGNDKDYDGWWGIWDDKFFSFMADKQKDFKEPFLSVVFSVTSHHPFSIPAEFQNQFKGGEQPILKCIQYTDYSLKKYFQKISKYPWFKNTIFVITGDHPSSNTLFKDSHTARSRYSVPLVFYRPDNSLASLDSTIANQMDVLPSVLGYLGYPKQFFAFGNNVFSGKKSDYSAWNFTDEAHHYYLRNYLLRFDGVKSIGLYDFKRDTMLTNNLQTQYPDTVAMMERKIKAFVQQYNNRMVENKLTVDQ